MSHPTTPSDRKNAPHDDSAVPTNPAIASLDEVLRALPVDSAADAFDISEMARLSESALAGIWDTSEEDGAWSDL